MSSARGRALSEQRRHPIHRAKKPWTNTKRPASNQPQNKRGETQAIANDINSKSCRDQHSTLRAMPKFPNGSLHKNKPSMNTIHVSIHTRNDPPKPSHKRLTRLGRDIHVALSVFIVSTSKCSAITSEKYCVTTTCRNLRVCHTLIQRWNVALSLNILSASNCAAITSEKHCMSNTCRNHMRSLSTDRWKGSFHCSEPHSRVALTMVDADVSNDV